MTALAAFWSLDSRSRQPHEATERILRGQQIYGPDPAVVTSLGPIAVGRRLFPTLPEDVFDRGPVTGGGGRWTLVADVRLDDRDELVERLAIGSDEARTVSDAALVMRSVERWPSDAIARLVGDFALILWDARDQQLTLARDFLGNRPLHLHRNSSFVAVGSMPKGLHALVEIPREPDTQAVAESVGMYPEHGSKSFYRHIERVEPGEIVTISATSVHRRRFWNPGYRPLKLRDDDYVEVVREAFGKAVEARLRGAGDEIGAQLSAGLDSSAVTATAAQALSPDRKVVAYTAAPPEGFDRPSHSGKFNDESMLAAEVAAAYSNIEHVIVRGSGQSPLAALERNYFLMDRPLLNLCNGVWVDAILDRARARGLKVMLTGDLGNLTTSYDGFEGLAQLLSHGRVLPLIKEARLLRRHGMRRRTTAARVLGSFLPRSLWQAIYRLRGYNFDITNYTALRADYAAVLNRSAKASGLSNSVQPSSDHFGVRKSALLRTDLGNHLKGTLGGWGIDLRDPTSDRRVVELCLSIPPVQFLKDGVTRSLARRAFADRLPQSIIQERRSGYQGADWYVGMRADWAAVRDETLRMAALPAVQSILDVERLEALLDVDDDTIDWNSRQTEYAYRLALLRGISSGHFLRKASGAN